jgi:hypothetical protein
VKGQADALRAEVERRSPVPRDDLAIVALRYTPTGAGHGAAERTERHGAIPAGDAV